MELKKINKKYAVFFGVFTLVLYLIVGLVQLILYKVPGYMESLAIVPTPVQLIVIAPLVGGIVAWLVTLLAIWIYNGIAKNYPISWEVKK